MEKENKMASEDIRLQSGNTSLDSKSSGGGQKSMLELLTITDAAVKAINKSTHSTSSHGSKRSQHSDPLGHSVHSDRSGKSGHSGRLDSDRSERSVHSHMNSDRSEKSAGSHLSIGQLQNDHSARSGPIESDRSVKSAQSALSAQSGHSVRSRQSAQSVHSGQSHHSGRSAENVRYSQQVHDASHDSGVVSKTQTVSEDKSRGKTITSPTEGSFPDHSSDVSTTASDVLIRSTLDKSEHSVVAEGKNGNYGSSSGSSKCSKSSLGVENFNSTGPQKVKISRKHLREIKPPFEEGSPRSSASSDGKVPSALLGKSSKQSIKGSGPNTVGTKPPQGRIFDKEVVTSSNESNGDKFPVNPAFPKGIDSAEFKVEKVRKSAEKAYEDVNMVSRPKLKTNGHILKDDKFDKNFSASTGSSKHSASSTHIDKTSKQTDTMKNGKVTEPNVQYRSTPKYYVERHTPKKSEARVEDSDKGASIPERKNLLQDLEASVEIVTAHARDTSGSSSRPEIVTVHEKIVTVTARNTLSPASSVDDLVTKGAPPTETYHSAGYKLRDDRGPLSDGKGKNLDESNTIPPALSRQQDNNDNLKTESRPVPARFQWLSRQTSGQGLQQGAPVSGHEAPDKPKNTDVHISDFKLSDKERIAKETFARRQGGPIRRVVQPRIVGHDSKASSTCSTGELKSQQPQLGQANDQVLTAAAAASAAVAATQPFLKAQQDMELKMAEVLARINEMQSGPAKMTTTSEADQERVRHLEKQLADMTDKRIDYVERLQEQQLAMQAKLISMTRETTTARPYHPRSYSPELHFSSAQMPNRAFTKTTVAKQPNISDSKTSVLDLEDSASPLDTPAPRARAPKPAVYDTSDIEYRVGRTRSPKSSRSPKARSSPKAKSPKARSPKRSRSPAKDPGILHQILASSHSPTRDTSDIGRAPAGQIRTEVCESPNVRKAKDLIDDLSHIKEQVKGLVEEKEKWKTSFKDTAIQDDSEVCRQDVSHQGPSPLDSYLNMPERSSASPYKVVQDLSSSKINAPVLPGFREAENILRQVQQNRGFLESNFEAVMRARQEVQVYSMLETVYNDSTDHEKVRIQKMVDKSIQRLRREVQREVTDDLVISELKKKAATTVPGAVKVPEPAPTTKQGSKYGIRGRLYQPKAEPKVEPKKTVRKPGVGGKENIQHKFYRPPPKRKSVFEDEEAMTRIYGKASYQKGRTTVKDPYLHYQNTAKPKPTRPPGHADIKGTEMMSSKTQTSGGGVRQFYFNPSTGTYIPVASAAAAPIPGQLIPMAVPLGGPRMDVGLTVPSAMSSTPMPFNPSSFSQVTAQGNVSMVSMGMEEDERKNIPELGKQVLPAVDIDTDISEISEIMEEEPVQQRVISPVAKPKKHVQIVSPRGTPNKSPRKSGKSPTKAHYEVMYHEESSASVDSEEKVEEEESITISHPAITHSINNSSDPSDDTLVDEDADVETATGLEFPGYQPEEVPEEQNNGPAFPPKMPSADRQLTSDLIAADIKRRDVLQNNATEWIEQELMARIITEIYPLKDTDEPPQDISHVVSEASENSMAEEKEKSMFVMDTIGHRGMQLFVDVGFPVDNNLVNKLVEEVLQEKVRTMLGQRPDSEDQTQLRGAARITEDGPQWEEPVSEDFEEPSVHQDMVRTPEPTPRASPRSSPPRRVSPAPTPLASPPAASPRKVKEEFEPVEPEPQVFVQPQQPMYIPPPVEPESEPESSASYDIKEEMDRLADKLRPDLSIGASIQSRHDVATPPESPKLEPEPMLPARPLTPPEPSPRSVHEEPFVLSQMVVPAGTSMEQTASRISKTKTESPKSATSPQVTEMAEEELAEDQPKPVVFTVAETQTDVVEESRPRTRSPSPAKTKSRTPSESSYTESSSISDTFNECVSEGQWLINKSDGEVADFPIDEVAVRDRMLRMNQRRVDVSSASTWKDIDDTEFETDVSRSEGEFLYKTELPPEKDPVLDMLARLQSAAPQYGMYHMSQQQVTDVLNTTGKSEGEVIRVNAATRQQQQYIPEQDFNYSSPVRSKSPRSKSPGGTTYQSGSSPRKGKGPQKRAPSPQFRTQSPTRVSFEGDLNDMQRSASPTRGILKRSSSFDNQQPMRRGEFEVPVRDSGRSQTPTGRLTPGGRQPQAKGMIGAGARSMTQGKSPGKRHPQATKSSTMPETRGSGTRLVNVRASSEDYRDPMDNTGGHSYYGSEYGSRGMTPDQMNMDALIQSGYLSQSFSQSENGVRPGQSSLRNSADVRISRSGQSFGYSYGTDESMTMSELQRLAGGSGKLKMSLTIPGTDQEGSDLSEIDITDAGNTR